MQILGRFKKPENVWRGKFGKVLLFDAPCGWGKVLILRGKAARDPAGHGWTCMSRPRVRGRRPLEPAPGIPLLMQGCGTAGASGREDILIRVALSAASRAGWVRGPSRAALGRQMLGDRAWLRRECALGPAGGVSAGAAGCGHPASLPRPGGANRSLLWVAFQGLELVSRRRPMSAL